MILPTRRGLYYFQIFFIKTGYPSPAQLLKAPVPPFPIWVHKSNPSNPKHAPMPFFKMITRQHIDWWSSWPASQTECWRRRGQCWLTGQLYVSPDPWWPLSSPSPRSSSLSLSSTLLQTNWLHLPAILSLQLVVFTTILISKGQLWQC